MVRVAGTLFALPISNVTRILRVTRDETERADGRLVVSVDGQPVPIASVSEALGLDGAAELDGTPLPAVLLGSGERRAAFGERPAAWGTTGDAPLVLVVDDASVTRTMVKGVLEVEGYRVQVDGMQAWEMLRSRSFDLVVSDVNMPEMSGFDLTEKVRADRFPRGIPVILVTAPDSLEDQAHGAAVGADAYITKGSFTDDTLIRAVRRFV
jgi:two-component system, chemotaxis family, sensor kinase CheA